MDADKETLLDQLDKTIEDVDKSHGNCYGHGELARGIAMSLRCHRAQLRVRSRSITIGAISGGTVAAVFSGIVALVRAWHGG